MGGIASDRIADLCRSIMEADQEEIETAIDAASDILSESFDGLDAMVAESILDGLRWGFRAAATIELGGGTLIRIRAPGGVAITHEWLDRPTDETVSRIMKSITEAILE